VVPGFGRDVEKARGIRRHPWRAVLGADPKPADNGERKRTSLDKPAWDRGVCGLAIGNRGTP